jgi:hypothetical protein
VKRLFRLIAIALLSIGPLSGAILTCHAYPSDSPLWTGINIFMGAFGGFAFECLFLIACGAVFAGLKWAWEGSTEGGTSK